MKLTLLLFLVSFSAFSQTQINGARIMNGTVTPPKLSSAVGRPIDNGTLTAPYELTFDEVSQQYALTVTSDIELTVASSGNVSNSRVYITATGDGSHVLTYPADWILKGTNTYNANTVNEIEINYRGSYTTIEFINLETIVIPTLSAATMDPGTDDLTLAFDNAVTVTTAGWSFTASGGAVTLSAITSGSGTATIVFDLSRNITSGEDMTLSYDPGTGNTLSLAGVEIASITNFFVDTGDEELPSNAITVDDSGGKDYTTITAGINAATSGQTVVVYAGTYRETPTGKNGVTVQPATGETVIVSGLELAGNSGWVLYSGNIYYKVIAPVNGAPRDGYSETLTSNTSLLANQVFKDGVMYHDARYPNIPTAGADDLMDITEMRHRSETVNGFAYTTVNDNGLPLSSSFSLVGAKLIAFGWFWSHVRDVTAHSSRTITYSAISSNDSYGQKYRQWYYVVGKLGLLDQANEWHYDPATDRLYVWQVGGGSPTGIEYKARNWGFDLRGVDNMVIKGIHFIGCDPVHGDVNSDNNIVDNIRATYMNHDVDYPDNFPGYGNAVDNAVTTGTPEMGTKLLGVNNIIKNSEFQYSASAAVWVGTSGRIENNLFEDISYDGAWGAAASFSGLSDNVVITRNTFARTGRSGVDMGYSYTGNTQPQNLNIEVSYNDFSGWCALNVDGGAIYSWGFRDLTGSTYHHNWFHDDGVVPDPTGTKLDGGQRAVYFDQGTGPVTVHHNVFWNNFDANAPSDMQDSQDIYSQMEFTGSSGYHRNSGGNIFYNNTIFSRYAHHSYTTYETNGTKDIFKNNLFNKIINLRWGLQGVGYAPAEDHNMFSDQSTNQSAAALGTGSVENVDFDLYAEDNGNANFFLESGAGGLFYRLHTSSPARNTGVVIAGITDTDFGVDDAGDASDDNAEDGADDGTPDMGAYKFADNADPWIPGYNAATLDDEEYIEDNNLIFTAYSATPTVISSSVYHGGTASFTNTDGSVITITMTGTEFEWYAEEYNHAPIVRVAVDGVTQDCDTGTGGTQDCDLYVASTTNNSTLIFSKTGMSAGQHIITLTTTGRNASNTTGYFVVHDAIKYTP